jgi:signal transduction histidine kinase
VDQAILSKARYRRYFRSSSFMMAVLFTVILGIAASILGYSGYYLNRNHFIFSMEQTLDSEYRYLSQAQEKGELQAWLKNQLKVQDRIYLLMGNDMTKIMGNLDEIPPQVDRLREGILYFTPNGQPDTYAAKIYTLSSGQGLLIGSNMEDLLYTERVILWMGAATIILMMAVVIVSYLISTFVVSRTNHIADIAQNIIDTGDLSRRIDIDSRWDDLSAMAIVLNMLLAKIDDLMIGIRRVADNIAHDLRTPLTRLRNNIEMIEADDKNEQQLQKVINDANHILSTFHAVLRISKIENAPSKENFKICDIGRILHDIVELYEPLADEKRILLIHNNSGSFEYYGDTDLLFQMVSNIIDNAIKFTPDQGKIVVSISKQNEKIHIAIEDSGIGIPESDFKYVFDRFFRGERSRTIQGNGLGLSMVQAVVRLHNGQIALENLNPGLKVHIIL